MLKVIFQIALATILLAACSVDRVNLVEHPRDREFYDGFVNNNKDIKAAPSEMSSLKLLKIGGLYDGRFALYDNGMFYYEINKLGNGTGEWNFENGALKLKAGRVFFDLAFTVSGAQPEGNETVVRFIDRNGTQRMGIQYQNMSACAKDEQACTLESFEGSTKGL